AFRLGGGDLGARGIRLRSASRRAPRRDGPRVSRNAARAAWSKLALAPPGHRGLVRIPRVPLRFENAALSRARVLRGMAGNRCERREDLPRLGGPPAPPPPRGRRRGPLSL